jgi:hypothetical protein
VSPPPPSSLTKAGKCLDQSISDGLAGLLRSQKCQHITVTDVWKSFRIMEAEYS